MQIQRVGLNRFGEIIGEFTLSANPGFERFRILFPDTASAAFRREQREISFLHQGCDIRGMRFDATDTNACATLNIRVGVVERLLERFGDIFYELQQTAAGQWTRYQKRKFVTAIAAQQIHGLTKILKPRGDQFQHVIPATMTKRIIDPFEIIEINPDQSAF